MTTVRRLSLACVLVASALLAWPAHAKRGKASNRSKALPERPVILPRPVSGGLQSSLSLNGYQFTQVVPLPNVRLAAPAFRATATLLNQSRADVPLAFADRSILSRAWNFRLYDAEGILVWQSEPEDEDAENPSPHTFLLRPGRALSRSVTIPLWLEDGPLAPGRYTVEALLLADTPLVVTSFLSVLPGKRPPAPVGTVKGLVVHGERDSESGQMRPAPGMRVTIAPRGPVLVSPDPNPPGPIVVPMAAGTNGATSPGSTGNLVEAPKPQPPTVPPGQKGWSGFTDENGAFTADLLPGDYVVTATAAYTILVYPPPPVLTGRAEITIRAGETTETTVVLARPAGPPSPVRPANE